MYRRQTINKILNKTYRILEDGNSKKKNYKAAIHFQGEALMDLKEKRSKPGGYLEKNGKKVGAKALRQEQACGV